MEQHWDHKIAKAYKAKDAKADYPKKDELWSRVSGEMHASKMVSSFWKVASILLALVTLSSVFAAIYKLNSQNEKLVAIEIQNLKLRQTVESLRTIEPELITEIQIVEKEKLVYKEVFVQAKREHSFAAENLEMKSEIEQLNKQLLRSKQDYQLTKDSLLLAHLVIEDLEKRKEINPEEEEQQFKLKPEKVKEQMQEELIDPTPKIKIQLFKGHENNIKFDNSSTLFKK